MNFFKKLFGSTKPIETRKTNPDNTKLNALLGQFAKNPSNDHYAAVVREILNGNCFLLLPSANVETADTWTTLEQDKTLNLTSIFNIDGLKVLGAFSDEAALVAWAKQAVQYTAIPTATVTDICKDKGIDRIVINSDQKNMFVLERDRGNIPSKTIETDAVMVGTPSMPLPKAVVDKLIFNFEKVDTIEEAYQYAQVLDGETSIVIGIKLSVNSNNAIIASQNAVKNALADEQLDLPLDMMVLETQAWLNTARGVENALFYKKPQ